MRETFLQAILESPEDDLPRLALADWLLERGESETELAFAQFVQLQIRGEGQLSMGGTVALALLNQYAYLWWPDYIGPPWDACRCKNGMVLRKEAFDTHVYVTRGFVEGLRVNLNKWDEYGAELVKKHPIREVQINNRTPWWKPESGWFWEGGAQSSLPLDLGKRINGGRMGPVRVFESRTDAEAELSRALLEWAKDPERKPIEMGTSFRFL